MVAGESPAWVNSLHRNDSAPRRRVDSGVKHHLRSSVVFVGRRGMRGRCNGPAPRANRGAGLFSGAAEILLFEPSPSFRTGFAPGRHCSTCELSLHTRPDAKQVGRKSRPKTSQRAPFTGLLDAGNRPEGHQWSVEPAGPLRQPERPPSVPAGSSLDGACVCFLPAFLRAL